MTESEYVEKIIKSFGVSENARQLFEKVAAASAGKRETVLADFEALKGEAGLAIALAALYRQQVDSGFVLADPLEKERIGEKSFFDSETGVTFRVLWNPDRRLRNNRELLLERGVISEHVDQERLINGGCFLCKPNIDIQNPAEITVPVELSGEQFFIGANFAYITNNHFTLINAEHRPQGYRRGIPALLNDFLDRTDGHFRVIHNGLAGSSIRNHEHFQFTTEAFPIEEIHISDADVVYSDGGITVSSPAYPSPVWLIEGESSEYVVEMANRVIDSWYGGGDTGSRTENIIAARNGSNYRVFVITRDSTRLAGAGKRGAMGAFEMGGLIVLSSTAEPGDNETDERKTFDNASLESVRQMIEVVRPEGADPLRLKDD